MAVLDHLADPDATGYGGMDEVPDCLVVEVPSGGSALVVSDMHLGQQMSSASARLERNLGDRLERWSGPGVLVLNGDVVELWGEPGGTVAGALDAHPRLTAALRAFAGEPGRRLVVVVGNHDAALAWDSAAARTLREQLGATCTLSVDLVFGTTSGTRTIRCEHGHAFDPANALRDPRNPLDSPLGQHIVQEVLPELHRTPLLADASALADPNEVGRFLASRLVYRQLAPRAGWLLAPLAVAVLGRIPVIAAASLRSRVVADAPRWLVALGVGLVLDVLALAIIGVLVARGVYAALAGSRFGPRGARLNAVARTAAASWVERGWAGLITGHTHQPELTRLVDGFYANSGCAARVVVARRSWWLLPPVFQAVLRCGWVEVDVIGDLRVRLVQGEVCAGEATWLERRLIRGDRLAGGETRVVAALPGDAEWPLRDPALRRHARSARTRVVAAVAVAAVAVSGLVSAVVPPLRPRLAALLMVMPVQAPQAAVAATVFASVALLVVAWGLRRGRSVAWVAAVGLLVGSAVLHLLKGLDGEEALVALAAAGWLAWHRSAFPAHPHRRHIRMAALLLLAGMGGVTLLSLVAARVAGASAEVTLRAALGRLIGDTARPLPSPTPMITSALAALGLSLLIALGWLLLRPQLVSGASPSDRAADLARARAIIARHGGDTLAYFALREDKSFYFVGDCVIAYDVRDGVCLVSPDPIGPAQQWVEAWTQFLGHADRHGWPVTVVGAAPGWLPVYQAAGMRALYLGDEAIVNCSAFTLEGRPMKGLRSGHHKVARAGYTVRFHDPAALPAALAEELRELAAQSRQGDTERGFSMTLSRLFDPRDTGLLLSVAYDPSGRPDAFCHWVPAPDVAGWSLDVMRRRTDVEVPNGLTDFVIIETIRHLKERGQWGLGLNFAVMRAVLAGERSAGRMGDVQRRLLQRVGADTQMASLWRYNEKYHPMWRPRYVVLAGLDNAPSQGLAIAVAEGVLDLPGRRTRRPGGARGRGRDARPVGQPSS
ncbi:phosphatidylglycerol lysyltransferase domain-containing protein [Micromonospora sp. R77]|uniref:phosphatidylglycerol lysyltransferase domain-containing protein n=1 Tax=Micromonospora sp. R77 TaxID=2925836 RepID=UPI001F624942|nr:phosphatidylglycerol lysyltransferase domain-containing protein [Micromonospora sp. R77]MCI4066357.1 phosphatidylglycerol lysyltransferase domain-containing protein [Micromonospora sp. R77]